MYYLTPKGFAEKSRLTAAYLSHSLQLYRRASAVMDGALVTCEAEGWRRVLLAGASELAEIAAHDVDVRLIGTFDPGFRRGEFIGRPVWRRLDDAPDADACIYCALVRVPEWLDVLAPRFGPERLIVPELVRPLLEAPEEPPSATAAEHTHATDTGRRLDG